MSRHWSTAVIEELRALDREEVPHGLYGLREAHRTGEWLPKLSAVLNQPSIQLARRLGCTQDGAPQSRWLDGDSIEFALPEPRILNLKLHDYADTKVRKFGNVYRLDNSSRVHHDFPALSRELPGLAKAAKESCGRKSAPRSFSYLLVGHFRREKDCIELCRQTTTPEFMDRYELTCVGDSWPDVHGRDFQTCLRLWYIEQPAST